MINIKELIVKQEACCFTAINDGKAFKLNYYRSIKESLSFKINSPDCLYIFLQSGSGEVVFNQGKMKIIEGMYFSIGGDLELNLEQNSTAIAIHLDGFTPLTTLGGPIENQGRLKYIDGCSDSLLLSPSRLGEPCLNLLHFPKNTIQTMHHHPSFRFGLVVSGRGESVSPSKTTPLIEGDMFFIPANMKHKFNTNDCEMNVIAFHPDSDWGPTDEVHPMKNKTIF